VKSRDSYLRDNGAGDPPVIPKLDGSFFGVKKKKRYKKVS
jgi:hypothetical protein